MQNLNEVMIVADSFNEFKRCYQGLEKCIVKTRDEVFNSALSDKKVEPTTITLINQASSDFTAITSITTDIFSFFDDDIKINAGGECTIKKSGDIKKLLPEFSDIIGDFEESIPEFVSSVNTLLDDMDAGKIKVDDKIKVRLQEYFIYLKPIFVDRIVVIFGDLEANFK